MEVTPGIRQSGEAGQSCRAVTKKKVAGNIPTSPGQKGLFEISQTKQPSNWPGCFICEPLRSIAGKLDTGWQLQRSSSSSRVVFAEKRKTATQSGLSVSSRIHSCFPQRPSPISARISGKGGARKEKHDKGKGKFSKARTVVVWATTAITTATSICQRQA